MDQFEYVMYGRVYRIEGEDGGEGSRLGVYVSYGGMFIFNWGFEILWALYTLLKLRPHLHPNFEFSFQVFWCDWREMLSICRDSIKMRMSIFLWRRSNSESNLLYLNHLWPLYFLFLVFHSIFSRPIQFLNLIDTFFSYLWIVVEWLLFVEHYHSSRINFFLESTDFLYFFLRGIVLLKILYLFHGNRI